MNNTFTGAGIFIVEYYNGTNMAVLFGNQGGVYNEPGGSVDPRETIEETAARETREETANLLSITPNLLRQISIPVVAYQYMSFIVHVQGLSNSVYKHNLQIIMRNCHHHSWRENTSMIRVPLNRLIQNASNMMSYVDDMYGQRVRVRDRTMSVVRNSMNYLIGLRTPIQLNQNVTLNSSISCIIGTHTFTVQNIVPKSISMTPYQRSHQYAIHIIPHLKKNDKKLHKKCGLDHGKLAVSLVGFSRNHPPMNDALKILSKTGSKKWTINTDTIKIKDKTLYFESKTFDNAANILAQRSFQKIKGSHFSGIKWHIIFDCDIPVNIIEILQKVHWYYTIVKLNSDGSTTRNEKYKVTKI